MILWLAKRLVARNPALTIAHAKRLSGLILIVAVLAVLGLAAFVIIRIADDAGDRAVTVATKAGTTAAVATGQAQTLDQLKDANDAHQNLRSSGERSATRHAECMLDSDRPAACERYRPIP